MLSGPTFTPKGPTPTSRCGGLARHWFRPAARGRATQAIYRQGVTCSSHTDSTGRFARRWKASGRSRVWGFGQAADMIQFAPEPRLSSIIDDWAPYLHRAGAGGDRRHVGKRRHLHGISDGHASVSANSRRRFRRRVRGRGAGADGVYRFGGEYHPFSPGRSTSRTARSGWPRAEVADDGALLGNGLRGRGPERRHSGLRRSRGGRDRGPRATRPSRTARGPFTG